MDDSPRAVELRVIGIVRNGRDSAADTGWGSLESAIEMRPEFAPGLDGLAAFSNALVLFHMHLRVDDEPPLMQRRPRGRADMQRLGVFAQRGKNRPNPVGITAVEIVRVEPARLVVRGLNAVDGTPVLDLKPYFPAFDRVESPRVPEWVGRLMKGYFAEE